MISYEERRLALLRQASESENIKMLITTLPDIFYVSGVLIPESDMDKNFCLLLTSDEMFLFLPVHYHISHEHSYHNIQFIFCDDETHMIAQLLPKLLSCSSIYAAASREPRWLAALKKEFPSFVWTDSSPFLSAARLIKSPEETALIAMAQSKTEAAIEKVLNLGICGRTEKEVSQLLMDIRLELGFTYVGEGIVSSGPNTALIHSSPSKRRIRKGDAVTIDIGGNWNGYRADMTRTFFAGSPSEEFKQVYSVVLEAHLAAFASIRPGMKCTEYDLAARRIIQTAGYGEYFPHGLGHGIGVEVHEAPHISPDSDATLERGMVFSDEPGIYLPDLFGIRIEDLITIEEDGTIHSLNHMTKELTVID